MPRVLFRLLLTVIECRWSRQESLNFHIGGYSPITLLPSHCHYWHLYPPLAHMGVTWNKLCPVSAEPEQIVVQQSHIFALVLLRSGEETCLFCYPSVRAYTDYLNHNVPVVNDNFFSGTCTVSQVCPLQTQFHRGAAPSHNIPVFMSPTTSGHEV